MATTVAGAELTRQQRLQQLALRAAVLRGLLGVWRLVDPTNLAGTIRPFASAAARLVQSGHRDSAAAAATYYLAFRAAEGVRGTLAVAPGIDLDLDLIADVLRAAGLSGITDARRRGESVDASARNGFVRAAGAASGLVLAGGRDTIAEATATDRLAVGWQRVTDDNPCAFCAMLVGRGPVYKTEAAAETVVGRRGRPRGTRPLGEAFHNRCGCSAEPVYRVGEMSPQARHYQRLWRETTQGLSGRDALNAFRRALSARPSTGEPTQAAEPDMGAAA